MIKKLLTVLVLGLAVFAVSCGGADLTEFVLEAKDGDDYTVAISGESEGDVTITVTGKVGTTAEAVGTTADTVATSLALGATPTEATTKTFLGKLVKSTDMLSEFTAATGITVESTEADENSYETSFEATFTDSAEKTKTVSFTVNIVTGPAADAAAGVSALNTAIVGLQGLEVSDDTADNVGFTAGAGDTPASPDGTLLSNNVIAANIKTAVDALITAAATTTYKGIDHVTVIATIPTGTDTPIEQPANGDGNIDQEFEVTMVASDGYVFLSTDIDSKVATLTLTITEAD